MTASAAGRIYLDHAATTPLREEARRAMEPFLGPVFGNASSLHSEGRAARDALEAGREAIRARLRAAGFRLAFTGGGTEADNAAILGALLGRLAGGAVPADLHVVASAVEHAAVLGAVDEAARWGVGHTLVPVDREGRVDPDRVAAAVTSRTVLVSVMAANNEVGTLEPLREIGALVRRRGVPFHTDAVQALGKIALELDTLPADLVTLSAHKIGGPKGAGALLVRDGVPFEGLVRGGEQEGGLRGGTEGVAGAVGFARALELAVDELPRETPRLAALRDRLRARIADELDGVRFHTPVEGAAPHILAAAFDGVAGESLLLLLDHLGLALSTGSACNTGAGKPSHVLAAMGVDSRGVRSSLRFSLGRGTTGADVDGAVERLGEALGRLRAVAPPR